MDKSERKARLVKMSRFIIAKLSRKIHLFANVHLTHSSNSSYILKPPLTNSVQCDKAGRKRKLHR